MWPSLPSENLLSSSTYLHTPKLSGAVILGVDEAGRGPVLGPMVYAVAFCEIAYKDRLKDFGFADSKVLSGEMRESIMQEMCNNQEMIENIGWATTIMTARDISEGMLRAENASYNLNAQAHDATIALIQRVIDSGYEVAEAYVDTVGPPDKYQAKLGRIFPSIRFTVTKKADSLFPIVSCASICAKVTRDASLGGQLQGCGSGYPSDPSTVAWLRENLHGVFGWGPLARYSWSTASNMLDKEGVPVVWMQGDPVIPRSLDRTLHKYDLSWFGSSG